LNRLHILICTLNQPEFRLVCTLNQPVFRLVCTLNQPEFKLVKNQPQFSLVHWTNLNLGWFVHWTNQNLCWFVHWTNLNLGWFVQINQPGICLVIDQNENQFEKIESSVWFYKKLIFLWFFDHKSRRFEISLCWSTVMLFSFVNIQIKITIYSISSL